MSEYIEREAAEILFRDARVALKPDGCKNWNEYITRDTMLMNAEQLIHILPAADVRPVVLCKDCVYAYPYGLEIKCTKHSGKADRFGEDATYSEFHSGNWYCADAQRKREKHGKV